MKNKKTFIHVDMDSLESIYESHDWKFSYSGDNFFHSSIENALAFFDDFNVRATFFVVARDLLDKNSANSIKQILQCGHRLASHSKSHPKLNALTNEQKREEIFSSKSLIEDITGQEIMVCEASYSIDHNVLVALGRPAIAMILPFFQI